MSIELRKRVRPIPKVGVGFEPIDLSGLGRIAKAWAKANPNPFWRRNRKQRGLK